MGNSNGKPVVLTDEVDLNHFRLLRVVGKGAFGKVRIVERRDTGLTFALKYIRKDEVVRSESVRNIIRERRMLEHLDHPFLCNLRYSFQDVEYLYIVVDLMTGGDLRFHISRKTFTEPAVCFWMAELGCALRYIHRQGVVHRDVKPDNILLDAHGHLHLADFNVATELNPSRALTGKSGTLAYLAPEVYAGRGYGAEVDWWSFGVTFYECIYNKRPFEGSTHDHLSQSIQRAEPHFPLTAPPVSSACQQAMQACLQRDGTKRLGAAGFDTFAQHPFFRHVDFAALERCEIEPVFCPASDKTNFDATYDLEELLLEEAPLEARARKPKPRPELREDATPEEIRARELHHMIETMFEPFNYTLLPPDRAPAAPAPVPATGSATARRQKGTPTTPPPGAVEVAPSGTRPTLSLRAQTLQDANSANNSPDGSPPLLPSSLPREYFPTQPLPQAPTSDPSSTKPPPPQNHSQRPQQHSGANPSPSGLQALPSPAPASSGEAAGRAAHDKPSGMLGFLSRNKIGRDRSPKPKARERGVLGKEGARVVVSHG